MRTLVARIRAVEERSAGRSAFSPTCRDPKLRVGKFADGSVELQVGQTFTLDDNRRARRRPAASICPIPRSCSRSSPATAC